MMDELIEGVLDDLGYDVRLKVEQQEALLKLVEGKHVIAFLPTGFGKSLIYTIFPIIKRKLTGKRQTVLVISPLRALMLDQQAIMKTHSIKAQCIIKDMPKESIQDIKDGNVDVILASPEAIMKKEWLQIVHQEPLWSQLCLLAFDEAHCISQWGLDFRPEYRKMAELVTHFQHIPSLLLTATATEKGFEDSACTSY